MGTQKITMGRRGDTEYEAKKSAALAQAGMSNPFVMGIQSVYQNGTGQATKATRDPRYGNTNLTTGDALDGEFGNFKPQTDAAGNQVTEEPQNLTGFLDGQYSQTIQPQVDSEMAGQQAAERVQMIAQGRQYMGLNDRQQMYQV